MKTYCTSFKEHLFGEDFEDCGDKHISELKEIGFQLKRRLVGNV